TPIPWEELDAAAGTIDLYAALIGLRRGHPALNGGGMRWLHVGDEVLAFVRESAEESILVVAARSDVDILLDPDAVAGATDAVTLFGEGELLAGADGIRIQAQGPVFLAWSLRGIG
ncbi:MAG: alpha-glucosidase C-terminal domain-containing protein, partial [Leifsonia sp.]